MFKIRAKQPITTDIASLMAASEVDGGADNRPNRCLLLVFDSYNSGESCKN